ncbi:restriction endonuclease subunit S [Vibrio sp. 10N.286.46.E10]|uniref:restriction endonuclease subunit S n=1 Tax=Vibrio sp. 10N.286.46.E10 TaxID=1884477 RepID=UPI000C84CFB1|nr:restriction endonuclease subunit S [Vibrio sp. 10N.286.46.E10]PMI20980.1 restriction endonuclease subunit S [Vibrio sp. 10N.286.46.E10]
MAPNGWERKKLPDFAWFQEGPGLRKWQFTDSGCKVINITNIVNGYLDLSKTERHITEEELNDKYKHFLCDADDIVIASSGNSYCKHGIVRKQDLPLVMNTSVIRFKPLENCDYEFLNQFLKSQDLKKQIDVLITGGAQPNFGPAHLKQVELDLPPLPEQRKIAKILSTWDKAISTTEKLLGTSKQQKKALMQQLLTGKKRLVNPETGKAFGGEWERYSMSDLVSIDRKSLGKKTADDFKFQYISLSDVDVGSISDELEVHLFTSAPSRARRIIQEGDILLSTVRPNLKGFAKVSGKHADCIASTGFSVLTPKKRVSGDYIYQYIFSSHVTGQIDSLVVGSNYPAINSSDVAGLKVYCPTYEEQQKIASVLTAADKEIGVLKTKLAHLKQEKKALMQQLLTGKRRVVGDEAI